MMILFIKKKITRIDNELHQKKIIK